VQQSRINGLQRQLTNATDTAFRQQLEPGFACGLITLKQAKVYLQQNDVGVGGTIIPRDAPTANVRIGSPRVDSCSYTSFTNNLTYLDVVTKSYLSVEDATKGFAESTGTVQNLKTGSFQKDSIKDVYASGVHYLLIDNKVLEIGASKPGAMLGKDQEQFVDQIVSYITSKL